MTKKILLTAICSFVLLNMSAQVTVGSGEHPGKAALLDIKAHKADERNVTSSRIGDGGLVLPRVKLENKSELLPFIRSNDSDIINLKRLHIGLVVYNLTTPTENPDFEEDIYVWNGNNWEGRTTSEGWGLSGNSGTSSDRNYIGTADSKALSIRTNATERLHITSGGNLGINTNVPQASLDINGNLIIREIKSAKDNNTDNFYELYANDAGEVYTLTSEPTSYSRYLGFDPMAPTHDFELPTVLEDGYLTVMEGLGIASCYGVPYTFTLIFKGRNFISGEVKRAAYKGGTTENPSKVVQFDSGTVIGENFVTGKIALETIGGTNCSTDTGHFFTINNTTGKISVRFFDKGNFYKDAGSFTITQVNKVKYVGGNG